MFSKTTWVDEVTPTSAANMQRFEQGIWLAEAPLVNAVPTSSNGYAGLGEAPVDGNKIALKVTTGGMTVVWQFIYVASEPGTHKWYFTGGAPITAEIANGGNGYPAGLNGAYGDLAAVFPATAIAFPVLGDYVLSYGSFNYFSNIANANPLGYMSPSIGGAAAVDQDAVTAGPGFTVPAGQQHMHNDARTVRKNDVAGNAALVMKFKYLNAPPVLCDNRWLSMLPVRIG